MKTIKFLVQTLLIAVPLVFASCSSDDDDYKVPTSENSDILLSNYKYTDENSENYFGAKFEYDSKGRVIEAYEYTYNATTKDTSYNYKYVFNARTGNKQVVDIYYPNSSINPSSWTISSSPKNLIYQNNKIVEIENYMGSDEVLLSWENNKVIKSVIPSWSSSAQDSIVYHKGNYIDFAPQEYVGSGYKRYDETKTSFSTYANYYQMIPIEYIATMEGYRLMQYFPLKKYFSDNAVGSIETISNWQDFSDAENTNMIRSGETNEKETYTLTFGTLSKKVPEKVTINRKYTYKYVDYVTPSNSNESESTAKRTITFAYVKK